MRVLGLIPARGGSKGIPHKNLVPLAGRPLLAHTCAAALASTRLTRVVLSTDDEAIAGAGRACGVEVPFMRPDELARDDTPSIAVAQHALAWFAARGETFDVLVLLQPTSPLRRAEHIDGALAALEAAGADTVVSVVEVPHNFTPFKIMELRDGQLDHYWQGPLPFDRFSRQAVPTFYARNGPAVLATRAAQVSDGGGYYGPVTVPYVMTALDSVDIDAPEDLKLAELLLTLRAADGPQRGGPRRGGASPVATGLAGQSGQVARYDKQIGASGLPSLKVLFCGLGSIGQRHVRNLRTLLGDEVEIMAYRRRGTSPVLNPDMTVRPGAVLETEYNIRAFSDLDEAIAQQPDAVFITNPNSLHLDVALKAARAGAHLFIEKPVADELDGLDELVELVERNKLAVFVAYQFRFHPGLALIKEWIDGGKLGQIVHAHIVNGEWLPGWHPYEDYRETHPARRDLGGGCLRIQTHELDYALWLFGLPRRVFAMGGHLSNLEVDVEDSVSVLLECRQNDKPVPVHIHLDYLQRPPQRVCEVIGDRGKVRYDYYLDQVEFHDTLTQRSEVVTFRKFDRNQMFLDELSHFLACLRGEEQSIVDLCEGIRSMKIGLAAAESLRTGASVEVDDNV